MSQLLVQVISLMELISKLTACTLQLISIIITFNIGEVKIYSKSWLKFTSISLIQKW